MEKNVQNKKDARTILRKTLFPVALVAAITMFLAAFLHGVGVTNVNDPVDLASNEEIGTYVYGATKIMLDISRYMAIIGIFVSISAAVLAITYGILSLIKVNKTTVKQIVVPNAINLVVSVVIIVFCVLCLTKVFDHEKWSYYNYDDGSIQYILPVVEDLYKHFSFMGVIFAGVFFISTYAQITESPRLTKQDENIKTFRAYAVFAFAMAIWMLPLIGFGCQGFAKPEDDWKPSRYTQWQASAMLIKFALAGVGAIAMTLLAMIPIAIFGVKESKNYIIIFAVLGGFTLIMFAVAAAFMKIEVNDSAEKSKWVDESPTCAALSLISWIGAIVGGSLAYAKTKKFLAPKVAKLKPAK